MFHAAMPSGPPGACRTSAPGSGRTGAGDGRAATAVLGEEKGDEDDDCDLVDVEEKLRRRPSR